MLDDELLARFGQGFRVEVIQSRSLAHFCRPVSATCSDGACFLRMPAEFGVAGADANVGRAVEAHWLIPGCPYLEEDDPAVRVVHDARLESGVRMQPGSQPRQQILITLRLGSVRIETGADNLVSLVVDAENEVARRLAGHAGPFARAERY